jgi:hypothetical protein
MNQAPANRTYANSMRPSNVSGAELDFQRQVRRPVNRSERADNLRGNFGGFAQVGSPTHKGKTGHTSDHPKG